MTISRGFASDNNSGVHPRILEALARVNKGHVVAYGDDSYTAEALSRVRSHFGADSEAFFVFNGTAANVLGLQALIRPHEAVVCAATAHIENDECGAPERFLGCKLLPLAASDGKLTPALVETVYRGIGDQHHVQPKVISVSQSTELGTVYSSEELRALSRFARERGLYLHMDGARLSNAAAALGASLRELTREVGVDVLSLGGTKNGLLLGEAVVFLRPELADGFKFIRKQGMQLASKMRFVAAQFEALLSDDLWLENARHANAMARLLGEEAAKVPGVRLARPVEANAVFPILPSEVAEKLREKYFFYAWNEASSEYRWVTSFDTTEEDVRGLVLALSQALKTGTARRP